MTDTMRVRLYWLDGRIEELKGVVDASTMEVVRNTADGLRRFEFAEEIDDEGFAIFWEEEAAADPSPQ